jgi:hypothetical protein
MYAQEHIPTTKSPKNEGFCVSNSEPALRRQLLHLSSPGYYREALRPVIRTLLDRLEART